jgi:hypothetical protein
MRKTSSSVQHDDIVLGIQSVRKLLADLRGEARALQKAALAASDPEKKKNTLLKLDEILLKIDKTSSKLDTLVVLEPYVDQLDD